TGAKPGVLDEDKDIIEEKVILELGDEQDSEFSDDDNDDAEKDDKDGDVDDEGDDHVSDTQDADDEDVETESDEDDIYKYKIRVRKDEDVEMKDAEVEGSDKGDEEITDAAKEEAEKTSEAKNDTTKTNSLHQGFCRCRLTPIISTVQQTPTPIPTPPITIDSPTIITAVHESDALSDVKLRVAKLEKDVSELKTVDHSSEALAVLQSQVPTAFDSYLDTKVGDVFQNELQKHTADLIHKYSLQHLPELTKKLTPTADQEFEKSPVVILKIKKEQAEKQKKPQFTIKSTDKATLKDENAMDKGVADTVKYHKRKHDDDEDPPAGPNQGKNKESESSKKPSSTKETPKGKAPSKGSNIRKSASAKEPVEEPIAEVIMDDADDDVALDDNQPQDASNPRLLRL
ncbi:hypothetical protein Tco_0519135, partial [Tanacetum coccineum]